jgi:hypothetical protein
MWKITNYGFTLQEVLIMAAMNVAPALIATDTGKRTIWRSRTHRSLASRRLSWQMRTQPMDPSGEELREER